MKRFIALISMVSVFLFQVTQIYAMEECNMLPEGTHVCSEEMWAKKSKNTLEIMLH
jgi:hypothetical protein